jgi:hypothetical protein
LFTKTRKIGAEKAKREEIKSRGRQMNSMSTLKYKITQLIVKKLGLLKREILRS